MSSFTAERIIWNVLHQSLFWGSKYVFFPSLTHCNTFTWTFWFQTCRVGSHHHQAAPFWLPTCFHGCWACDLRSPGRQTSRLGNTGPKLKRESGTLVQVFDLKKLNSHYPWNNSDNIYAPDPKRYQQLYEGMLSEVRCQAMRGDVGWYEVMWDPLFLSSSCHRSWGLPHALFQHAIVRPPAPTIFQP